MGALPAENTTSGHREARLVCAGLEGAPDTRFEIPAHILTRPVTFRAEFKHDRVVHIGRAVLCGGAPGEDQQCGPIKPDGRALCSISDLSASL